MRRGPDGLPEVARRYPPQVPAKRLSSKHMMLPKSAPGWNNNPVERALAVYTPPERRVLNKVAETADIVEVDGKAAYLLIPSTPALLDDLAQVGAQFVDLDDIEDLEPANEDGETGEGPDCEPSLGSPDGQIDQTRWACGSYNDREHDPADIGEPEDHLV